MDRRIYLNELFDYYKNLLTDKEVNCFLDYYENDLSLTEIAENNGVSRSAIHKMIKTIEDKLESYEDSLHIYEKNKKLLEITKLDDIEIIKEKINELI